MAHHKSNFNMSKYLIVFDASYPRSGNVSGKASDPSKKVLQDGQDALMKRRFNLKRYGFPGR